MTVTLSDPTGFEAQVARLSRQSVDKHFDAINAEFAMTEGGSVPSKAVKQPPSWYPLRKNFRAAPSWRLPDIRPRVHSKAG